MEIFDTAIAIMAGLMIIPAVFAFSGGDPDTLQAGPALMFITIPKVFASMGFGTFVGILFFLLVLFAALTSSIALTESAVSTFEDELGWSRKKATLIDRRASCWLWELFPVWATARWLDVHDHRRCSFWISLIS